MKDFDMVPENKKIYKFSKPFEKKTGRDGVNREVFFRPLVLLCFERLKTTDKDRVLISEPKITRKIITQFHIL